MPSSSLDEEMWRLALEAEGALGLREAIEERYGRLRELLCDRLALEPTKKTEAFPSLSRSGLGMGPHLTTDWSLKGAIIGVAAQAAVR